MIFAALVAIRICLYDNKGTDLSFKLHNYCDMRRIM